VGSHLLQRPEADVIEQNAASLRAASLPIVWPAGADAELTTRCSQAAELASAEFAPVAERNGAK